MAKMASTRAQVDLSRRAALVSTNAPDWRTMSPEDQDRFVNDVLNADGFSSLSYKWQRLIESAEAVEARNIAAARRA